jgi:hypothetical protein
LISLACWASARAVSRIPRRSSRCVLLGSRPERPALGQKAPDFCRQR